MSITTASRRTALKLLLAGSVTTLASGCEVLNSIPRGGSIGSSDGKALSLEVLSALRNHPDTARLSLAVSSVEDEVIIKGSVDSRMDIDSAERVAGQVSGVRFVSMNVFLK